MALCCCVCGPLVSPLSLQGGTWYPGSSCAESLLGVQGAGTGQGPQVSPGQPADASWRCGPFEFPCQIWKPCCHTAASSQHCVHVSRSPARVQAAGKQLGLLRSCVLGVLVPEPSSLPACNWGLVRGPWHVSSCRGHAQEVLCVHDARAHALCAGGCFPSLTS